MFKFFKDFLSKKPSSYHRLNPTPVKERLHYFPIYGGNYNSLKKVVDNYDELSKLSELDNLDEIYYDAYLIRKYVRNIQPPTLQMLKELDQGLWAVNQTFSEFLMFKNNIKISFDKSNKDSYITKSSSKIEAFFSSEERELLIHKITKMIYLEEEKNRNKKREEFLQTLKDMNDE